MVDTETANGSQSTGTERVAQFACTAGLPADDPDIETRIRRRVLDTLAAITAGYRHESGAVVRDHVLDRGDGGEASVLDGTGRSAPIAEATLANATAANVLDIDDGHREVKGHPSAVVIPAALAAGEETDTSVKSFLDAVYVGYEVAVRAGLTIHAVDGLYTGSGSWGAVGAAAAVGRLKGFDTETMAAALGTAEYHAPRTPIMRGVEQPGMTKDGIGWGSYTGVEAATLCERGFTGSGTAFDESEEFVEGLGTGHHVTESYLKLYPCCRWAQPGVEAVRELTQKHDIEPSAIRRIVVETFEEATHLKTRRPDSIEAAEYSYPYPVSVMAVRGQFNEADIDTGRRNDSEVRELADRVVLTTDDELDAHFPEECLATVTVETTTETYRSGVVQAPGTSDRPLSPSAFRRKCDALFSPTLPADTFETVEATLDRSEAPLRQVVEPWR